MRPLLLTLTLVASCAFAEHTVSVGGFANTTLASFNSSPLAVGAAVGWLWTRGPFGVGAGLRVSRPTVTAPVPLEVYVRGAFTAVLGPWEPLLGPELGVSGLSGMAAPPPKRPTDLAAAERAQTGPVYVAFHTEALRFRFGRLLLSLLGVDAGTSLTAAGAVLRLQLDVLSLGVRW